MPPRLLLSAAALAITACSGDGVRHTPDAHTTQDGIAADAPGGPAAALGGLRWELPCGADLGGNVCAVTDAIDQTATVTGTTGAHYAVTLRFRGVVETKAYTGGTTDNFFNTGGSDNGDTFNVYSLAVSAPAQTYFVNTGTSGIYHCFAMDYMETIPMDAGATVTLSAKAIDAHEIENLDGSNMPIVIPDIAPAPAAYAGQFVQMDVVGVATM